MRKLFLVLFLFGFTLTAVSQKAKIDFNGDTAIVDGKPLAVIDKKSGLSSDFTIKGLNGTALIYFSFQEFNNPDKKNASNPNGRVTYYQVTFLDATGGKCEKEVFTTKKAMAKLLKEYDLLSGNELNAVSVKNFIAIHGMRFSEEKAALNGPKVIIIEK